MTPHRIRRAPTLPRILPGALAFFLLIAGVSLIRLMPPAIARDLAAELQMHYMHQYLGNASDSKDCGPTSVAMALDAFGRRPAGLSDRQFVAAVRNTMGVPPS